MARVDLTYRGRTIQPAQPRASQAPVSSTYGRQNQTPYGQRPPVDSAPAAPTFAQPRWPTGQPTFTDFERDYHAPDRQQVLLNELLRDYHAPDRQQVLQRYGYQGQQSGPGDGGFDWNRWDELTRQYGSGTVADLDRLVREHPELGVEIVGGSRGDIKLPSGDIWDVILAAGEGGRGWQRIQAGGGGQQQSSFNAQFSDPYTKKLEEFLNQRFERLMQPAYTGTEQEILRTQALDPIERDRQASRQRGLQNISARGLDPSSGIALDLLNQIDAGYDRTRAGAQNQLATAQIQEQRSREQEAQALLSLLYDLPNRSLQQSLAVLGMGPTPESLFNQAMGLYGIGQQQRQQGAQWYQTLGQLLPYLFGNR